MWSKVLLISLLLVSGAFAQRPTIPIARDTSKASKNLLRESKTILKTIQPLSQYNDSNYIQWDIDTTNAASIDTVFLPDKYASSNFGIFPTVRDLTNAGFATAYSLSDSSFVVKFGGTATWFYQWFTIGIKKK